MIKLAKLTLLASATALLAACSSGSLPKPAPLQSFKPTLSTTQAWKKKANHGNNNLHFEMQPAISGDTLYTAGNEGTVSAVNISTGQILWQQHFKDMAFSSGLTAQGNALYLGTNQGQIVKLDNKTGKMLWTQRVPSTVMAAPAANEQYIFVKTIDDTMTALSASTGEKIWHHQEPPPSLTLRDASSPIIESGQVLAGFSDAAIYSFNQLDGDIHWSKQAAIPEGKTSVEQMVDIDATPVINANHLYLAAYQSQITAYNLSSQAEIWSYKTSIHNDLAVDSSNVYASDATGNVIALDKTTGEVLWKQEGLKNRGLSAPADIGNEIVVGDKKGYLHFLNKMDGSFSTRIHADSSGISATPMLSHGLLIVLSNDGYLHAYKVQPKQ